jgi:hypothetical protein
LTQAFNGTNAFLRRLHAQRFAGRAIDLRNKRGRWDREGVADHPREPFVVTVLQRLLAGLGQLEIRRHELDHATAFEIA